MNNDMKLIVENWRQYQEQTLLQEGVVDYLKAGFKALIRVPKKFDSMVAKTKEKFEEIFRTKLEETFQAEEMQSIGKEVADKVAQSRGPEALREGPPPVGYKPTRPREFTPSTTEKQFSLQDLKKMGVGDETIELVAHTVTTTAAESLIESCESVVGKATPPEIRDWLVRFVSKFIGAFVFGFIDNFIMVIAGAQIDTAIGGAIGAAAGSAMANPMFSAGLGNTISDFVGELASNSIESVMGAAGLDVEAVTDESVAAGPLWMRFLDKQASVIGIILGCLAGLFPLFLEEEKTNDEN